ncbi:general secretion pathway protein GspB [Halochromatium roseum]|uniref:general secretion pathway protein GspB n=1 Tax=Halochromatium roseum TaxID=391920 RepID=UPI001914D7D4|nr:general secretion pathway protein GspB [Halochromatium roseum]MBK5940262.1 hypothetical protein [Halochromatium roseum]
MSYILEALKKSQQEREMGQVPRLQATAFEDPLERTRTQPWVFTAVGLAALAVVVAIYAALRPTTAPDASSLLSGELEQGISAGIGSGQRSVAGLDADSDEGLADGSSRPEGAALQAAAVQGAVGAEVGVASASSASPTSPLRLSDPDDLSVEPQVLVVPAAPKPGERLPRGADELRRAVLGPEASPSIERRQASPDSAPPERDFATVPPDLIAEIEDFKRTFQSGGTRPAASASRDAEAVRRSAAAPESTERSIGNRAENNRQAASGERPAPLSSTLRRQLPPFLMTVHVYDDDPVRRFVYLNGAKVREGELTRDGFFVEQVLADGAIVRYDDYRFFQSP